MSIFQIALDHLKRRKAKSIFLMIGLVIGVATVVGLMSIVQAMRLELGNELDKFGPNIIITPKFQGQEMYYGGSEVTSVAFDVKPLTESDLIKIRSIPDRESINIISPKLVGAVTLNDRAAILVGVENKNEFKMKPWISLLSLTGTVPGDEMTDLSLIDIPENGLILGVKAAKTYGAEVGETMLVNGENFTVIGILEEFGTEEDGLIYANLSVVQKLLGREGMYSMIEVSGFCNFCPIEDMASQMTTVLPNGRVTALRQAALVREETINRFATFGYIFSLLALVVAMLFVVITMLSSVNERTHEIGIFRAIGFKRFHIIKIIIFEAFFLSLFAGLLGFILGTGIARIAGTYLAQMQVSIPWNVALILPAISLSVLLAVLSSLYPALKAARLDPMEALRCI
ncbi:MAG: FtsX-like permease family protein [Clostridiaceae bacterium]